MHKRGVDIVRVLANTPIIVKALFIVAIPLAMLTLWMVDDLQKAYKDETSMQTMQQAADIAGITSSLINTLQKERSMSAGSLGKHKAFFSKALKRQHQETNENITKLAHLLEQNSTFIDLFPSLHETLQHFMQDITTLNPVRQRIEQHAIGMEDLLSYYTDLTDDLIQASNNIKMIYTFTSNSKQKKPSNSTIVPNAHFSGLMSSFIQLSRAEEAASIEHAVLSNIFSTDHLEANMYERLINQITLQEHLFQDFSLQSPDEISKIFSMHYSSEISSDIERFRNIAINKKDDGNFGISPEQWFQASSKRIALLHQVEGGIVELIRQQSQQGVEQAGNHVKMTLSKGLATLLIAIVAIWTIWLLLQGLRHASQAVQSIEAGEYDIPVVVKGNDEMGRMLAGVEKMRLSLMAAEEGRSEQEQMAQARLKALLQAKDEVKKEHELIERLLSAMPSILIAVDTNGIISLWNDVAENVFGLSRRKVTGTSFASLSISWDWDEINRALAESEAFHTSSMDHVKFKHNDGSDRFLGLTINTVMEHGRYNGFLLVGADKTTRMQLENQLQMSQRMESMGELAAGIAHEINTPMQYIGDNVRFLKDGFHDMLQLISTYHLHMAAMKQEDISTSVQQITEVMQEAEESADLEFLREEVPLAVAQTLEGIAHVSKIVGAMKELSHPGTGDKMPIDINKVIESAVTVSKNEWKYVADLDVTLDPQLPMIHALPEINQVFLNIIINAAHAIADKQPDKNDEKGRIHIQTCHANDFVEIHISDSGSGIPADKLDKIFNPFFTTKEPGKGTGQGLAISHQIVCNRLGGQLTVKSEPGHGACFSIKLPLENA